MAVTIYHPKNRLAEIVRRPGGITVEEALTAADRNLESMRGECLLCVDELLDKLRACAAADNNRPNPDVQRSMYNLSNEIVTLAVTHQLFEMSQAARSLCELLDRQLRSMTWKAQAVDVHIASLALLRTTSAPSEAARRGDILAGLIQVTAKMTE